jgi:RNA polymerase sigma factor (sigma-70 family)
MILSRENLSEHEWLAGPFEEHRGHLRAVAYRMLGSLNDADDAVQEAWLRLSRSDAAAIENLGGWLTTVVARVSLSMLRSRRSLREEQFGVRVPDPVVSLDDELDPEQEALVADSVGLALLVVLETLEPAERLAFVLHDIFAVPFSEIAPIVDRSPAAARQLASRARRRVRAERTFPMRTSKRSARSSRRFSPPPARATSRPCWRFSTRTSSSTLMPGRGPREGAKCVERRPSPGKRSPSPSFSTYVPR